MTKPPASDSTSTDTQEIETAELSGAERRRFRRIDIEVRVDLRSENNFFTGFSENVSEGGLFVATEAPHPMGSIMEVTLSLMGSDPMTLQGEVSWIRPPHARGGLPAGFGLRFFRMTAEQTTVLQSFVDSEVKDTLFYDLD